MNNYSNMTLFDPQKYAEIVTSARQSMNFTMKLYNARLAFMDDEPNDLIVFDSLPEKLR